MEAEWGARYYHFAGLHFRVSGPSGQMYSDDGVLAQFRSDPAVYDNAVEFEIVDTLPLVPERCIYAQGNRQIYLRGTEQITCLGTMEECAKGAYLHIYRTGGSSRVRVLREAIPDRIKPRLVLNVLEAEHFMVHRCGFLLHASFICCDGRGIVFTAPSGTGKSTQAGLWNRLRGARQINGDRVALRLSGERVLACGIPYSGTSGICEAGEYPLRAIVYLSQAPVSEIQLLRGRKAFRCLWEGCSVNLWNREDVEECTKNIQQVLERVPVYHLACTPDASAVEVLERVLPKGEDL